MSNAITEAREDVRDALGSMAGVQVYEFIPERMSAPAAVITPGAPYVRPGQTFNSFVISLNVRLFMRSGTNEVMTEGLDSLIASVIEALRPFGVVSVDTPGVDSESYDTPYLVTDVAITTTYKGGN